MAVCKISWQHCGFHGTLTVALAWTLVCLSVPTLSVRADVEFEHSIENVSEDDVDKEESDDVLDLVQEQESSRMEAWNVSYAALLTQTNSSATPRVAVNIDRKRKAPFGLPFDSLVSFVDRGTVKKYLHTVATSSIIERVRQKVFSGGDCLEDAIGERSGCRKPEGGCSCGWAGRCYPFEQTMHGVQIDVGSCGLGIIMYTAMSFLIILLVLSFVILLRIFVQHREPLFPPLPVPLSTGKFASAAGKKAAESLASPRVPAPTWAGSGTSAVPST